MGRLEIRLDKQNLGGELKLGIVAEVLQIKDPQGNFPTEPFEQEVVIPAGTTLHREVPVPAGTYRIKARLPSGEVLSQTETVPDEAASVKVVFQAGRSPHEWLSWQRLAGNVPSQQEYETFLTGLADQMSKAVERSKGVRIQLGPTTIGWAAGKLRQLHVQVSDYIKQSPVLNELAGGPVAEADAAPEPTVPPLEFELVEACPCQGETQWSALSSRAAWTEWRRSTSAYAGCSFERADDRELTLWRVRQTDRAKAVLQTAEGMLPRRCLAVMRRGEGVDIASLPVPWPIDANEAPATIEILREAGASASGKTNVIVQDSRLGSLLMYLGSGRIGKAATVLAAADQEELMNQLLGKQPNPIAACAVAYVALASMTNDDAKRWNSVLERLAQFEWLPDGAIVRGAYLLKIASTKAQLEEACASFRLAYQMGLPFFLVGVQHLRQGLYSFSAKDAVAGQMYEAVTKVALQVDPDQAFTLVHVAPTMGPS